MSLPVLSTSISDLPWSNSRQPQVTQGHDGIPWSWQKLGPEPWPPQRMNLWPEKRGRQRQPKRTALVQRGSNSQAKGTLIPSNLSSIWFISTCKTAQGFPSRDSQSVSQFSCSFVFDSLWPRGLQHARLPCPALTPGACSNSWPSSWWCHPTILTSVVPFTSCLQYFPGSRTFSMSQFFASGGQGIGASASASVLLMNVQDWFDFL